MDSNQTTDKNWRDVPIKEVLEFKTGKLDSNAAVRDGAYPFFTCSPKTLRINSYEFDTEAVLLAGNNARGIFSVKYFSGKFNAYQRTYVITPRNPEIIDCKFAYFQISHLTQKLRQHSIGTATKFLTRKMLDNVMISLPTISEQQKIAFILSTVDDSVQKSDQIITKTQQLKKGLMQQLITRGIGHTKFKQTAVGEIPDAWEIFRLGDVAESFGGATPSTNVSDYWNGAIPFVTPTDVTNLRGGNFLTSTKKSITKAGFNSISAKCVPTGSVLVTSRATIGSCCINAIPAVTNQGFINLVCKNDLYNLFALYLVRSLKRELERLSDGSTFKELARRSARKVMIPLPPLSEQKKIASILSTLDDRIKTETQRNEELQRLKRGLANILLTGKVRVKVT